jgi:hypothetical protein
MTNTPHARNARCQSRESLVNGSPVSRGKYCVLFSVVRSDLDEVLRRQRAKRQRCQMPTNVK